MAANPYFGWETWIGLEIGASDGLGCSRNHIYVASDVFCEFQCRSELQFALTSTAVLICNVFAVEDQISIVVHVKLGSEVWWQTKSASRLA